MPYGIIRGRNGRRHEVDFGDTPESAAREPPPLMRPTGPPLLELRQPAHRLGGDVEIRLATGMIGVIGEPRRRERPAIAAITAVHLLGPRVLSFSA
jgi:hypothetical protein